jgi:hypothetical protein
MVNKFEPVTREIAALIEEWEPKLSELSTEVITERKNSQNRSIKQILGHLIDSASNNIHRYVHLQYRESPMEFPNYASEGNNDRWIAIQQYQTEDWEKMIRLWIYINYHLIHVIRHINPEKLDNMWIAGPGKYIPLKEMVIDYLRHLKLHLTEISDLMPEE